MKPLGSRLVCAGCGAVVTADEPRPFRCPHAEIGDDTDHVLHVELELDGLRFPTEGEANPYLRFRELLHVYRAARQRGMSDADFVATVRSLDASIAEVAGRGFRFTPYARNTELERELGLEWLSTKDETANVGGTHKARHLMGIVLQLALTGADGPQLAISSCGNAALAAGLLAKALGWDLTAFVPDDADARIVQRLEELGATVTACSREAGAPGDPCIAALEAAIEAGDVPFTVQGNRNALAVEGGTTLPFELVAQHAALDAQPLDRLVVQVGGGALASACASGLRTARALGIIERLPRFMTVQTSGVQPLHRAWRRVAEGLAAGRAGADPPDADLARWIVENLPHTELVAAVGAAARQRSGIMWPWENVEASVAYSILDDETYDGFDVITAMLETGGWPLAASEVQLVRARELAARASGRPVDATGAAGLAGLLALAEQDRLDPAARTAVLFTGVGR